LKGKYGFISTGDLLFVSGLEDRLPPFPVSATQSIGSQARGLSLISSTKKAALVISAPLSTRLFLSCLSVIDIHIYIVRKQQALVEQRHLHLYTRDFQRCKTWYLREAIEEGTQCENIRGLGGQPE